ncbi:ArnT family glycosyltransferase [Vampirovibrio sp.]|uniref:ArnT family glycosyltransferase n=1 Tax=Vampirovibrio sp. TaxID=2717857 RepID=UPI003594307D
MGDFWLNGFEGILFTAILYLAGFAVSLILGGQAVQSFRLGKPSRWAWLLLLIGLILRLSWIVGTQPDPISDYAVYWNHAEPIAGGDFAFNNIDKHPGIIVLLAFCRAVFGSAYWPVWTLNLVLSGLIMVLIYLLGQRLFSRSVGLIALALSAFQPQLISYSALFASELPTLYFYLLLSWLILESRQPKLPNWLHWAGLGVVLYTAVLTRSTALVFGMLAVLTVLFFRRDDWKANVKGLAVFGVTASLLLSSWVYHQYLLTGKAQLFWGGEIWLVATTHYETESRLVKPENIPGLRERIDKATTGKTGPQKRMAELNEDKAWAMAIIGQNPLRYFLAGPVRLRHILWTTSETGIRDTQWGSSRLRNLPEKTVTRLAEISKQLWRVTLILGISGALWAVVDWKRNHKRSQEGLLILGGFLMVWLGFHYLMAVASDRWALQIIPFTLLFAALSIINLWKRLFPSPKSDSPLY